MVATILVVEDELPIAEVIKIVMEEAGHRVILAHDGATALEQIKHDGFDLLVTDNMLPYLSGVELIRYMHEHPAVATPVILTSAVPPTPAPPRTVVLSKPFDIDRLTDLVNRLLGAS